jgi:Tfp pilus assembly protein PilV
MTHTRRQRGSTLLEAMIAMGVLMVGAAGLVGLQTQSTFFMGDSRRTTRASAFAQDLLNQIELWDYTDPRLANRVTDNDLDLGDSAGAFQLSADPIAASLADHGEADLTLGGTTWTGLPQDLLLANGMERYWNVSYVDNYNGNDAVDAVRIAVIVRWRAGASWRRAVFMGTKINPADAR